MNRLILAACSVLLIVADCHAKKATQVIRISLNVPEKCTPDSCPLTINITNVSEWVLTFTEVIGIPEAKVILTDSRGKLCSRTPKGMIHLGDPPFSHWSTVHPFLKKGEKKSWTVDLADFFKLSAGEWTMAFSIPVSVESRINNNHPGSHNIAEVKNFKFSVQ